MSVSPSFPHGAPSLAEVLIQRTFAKPPRPFVDGEFLEALQKADDGPPAADVHPKAQLGSAGPGSGSPHAGAHGHQAASPAPAAAAAGRTVDLRA